MWARQRITLYPGQYQDEETGLHYNWFRYYDPKIGRYLRPDPIGFAGKDVNLYEYVRNNPLMFADTDGRDLDYVGSMPLNSPFLYYTLLAKYREQGVFILDEVNHLIDEIMMRKPKHIEVLTNALTALCPEDEVLVQTNFTSVNTQQDSGSKRCCHNSCKEQAAVFANAYMEYVTVTQILELQKFGEIIGDWRGNFPITGHGMSKGESFDDLWEGTGLECQGWADLAGEVFYGTFEKYNEANTLCFRGAKVIYHAADFFVDISDRPSWMKYIFPGYWLLMLENLYADELSYHEWFVIYGPTLHGRPTPTNANVTLDPWITGGERVMYINDHPYTAIKIFVPYFFKTLEYH